MKTHHWEDGWALRNTVADDLERLRDCDTCSPFTEDQREHIDTLIKLYAEGLDRA